MAKSNELAKTRVITQDGILTATLVDKVSADRVAMTLFKAAAAAKYGGVKDQSSEVSDEVKGLVIFPFSEL